MILRVDTPAGSREMTLAGPGTVPFVDVESFAATASGLTHATFHATDGYAASIPIEQARADSVLEVPDPDERRTGVRLIVREGGRACLNVKAVVRVELTVGQGRHTVDPNPHRNAHVPGWDGPAPDRDAD